MIGNVHCLVKGRGLWYSYGSKGTGCKELFQKLVYCTNICNMVLRCKLNKPVFSFRRRKYLSNVEINGAFFFFIIPLD